MARNPKPTALLKLEKGKLYDQQRDRAELEPQADREIEPSCPARFANGEKKVWKEIGAILKNYGLFTAANAPILELLATAWAQYISISAKINTGTLAERIILNDQKIDRLFKKQHQLADRIKGYLQELGLSSIAMAKIGSLALKKRKQKSEMESLLD
jgi:phage terminase small subunit